MRRGYKLTAKDLVFAAINGAIFGIGFTVISNNSIPFSPDLPLIFTTLIFSVVAVIGVTVGSLLSLLRRFFFQLSKFGVVGAANTAVDLGVFNLLLFFAGGPVAVMILPLLKSISFFAAVINSYIWNRYWSFDKHEKASADEFVKFVIISIIGLGLNAGITTLLSALLSHDQVVTSTVATLSAAIASLVVLMWNFLGYKLMVFKK